MPGVADEDAFLAVAAIARDFHMHLGYQRAGGIEHLEATLGGLAAHGLGDTMGTEDENDVVRHIGHVFDEDGAAGAQVVDHELVVHHFMTHIDGRTENIQRPVDDVDGAVHAGAEAAGIGELDLHRLLCPLHGRR